MIYAVLLCNKEWNIVKIKQNVSGLSLKPGDCLADVVQDADELTENDEKQYSLFLTFRENGMTLSTLVRSFQEGNLVILSHVRSDADFVEFNNEYLDFVEWVENHLEGFYHSEYFQIQKLNNQLIDSQRALIRSKRNLEMALEENKKINRKISEARQAAEQASRSKTQFLANMSHDIRTPMNAIVGLTKLMQYSLNDPETLDSYIQKLQSSSEYLLGLINDILDLSKIESGSIELKKESMNLRKVAEQIAAIIRPNVLSGGKKFRISEESFCHEHVLGDSIRIRQVLMNLLSNAVKYTPEGGEISLRVEELSSDKKYAKYRFTVEETGIGMTEEFLQHIFEPFARANDESISKIQGTGLGLAITQNIVQMMNGTIEVQSRPGEGSTFTVTLKHRIADESYYVKKHAENPESCSEILEGRNILLAEDNDLNAEIAEAILERAGLKTERVEDGIQCVNRIMQMPVGTYDVILMDIQMPKMDGYKATQEIRNLPDKDKACIPIIAMTANAFEEDKREAIAAGMNEHIAKPVQADKLLSILSEVIRQQEKY